MSVLNQIIDQADPLKGDQSNIIHTVRIKSSSSPGKPIVANLPASVRISVASDWSAPFADKAEGGLSNLVGLLGASLKTKALSAQRWVGSSPIEVTIPFVLIAQDDPKIDILQPIAELTKLCLPDAVDGERFIPPGTNFLNYIKGKSPTIDNGIEKVKALSSNKQWEAITAPGETITVEIGGFIIFSPVVMLSVNPTLHTQRLHHSGLPLKAEVEITFRMYTTSIKAEVDKMYKFADLQLSVLQQTGGDADAIFGSIKSQIKDLSSKVSGYF